MSFGLSRTIDRSSCPVRQRVERGETVVAALLVTFKGRADRCTLPRYGLQVQASAIKINIMGFSGRSPLLFVAEGSILTDCQQLPCKGGNRRTVAYTTVGTRMLKSPSFCYRLGSPQVPFIIKPNTTPRHIPPQPKS